MKKLVKRSIVSTKFFIKDNTIIVVFITLFTLGTAVGSLSLGITGDKSETLIKLLKQFFYENKSLSVINLFSRNLISSFLYLGAMYIAGLCAIGLPIVGITPLIKGISLGMIISYKYIFDGIKGFLYSLLIIILPSALIMSIYNYAYVEGIYMSLAVSNGIFNGKPRKIKYESNFMTFTKRYILFSFGTVLISLLEAVLTSAFVGVI